MASQYVDLPVLSGGGGGVTSLNGETGAVTLVGGTGITVTPSGSNITIASTGGGSGTVTSVALADSTNLFNVTGSPVTTSGTLTLSSYKSQSANTFLSAPNGSSGAPTFRTITNGDLNIPGAWQAYTPVVTSYFGTINSYTATGSYSTIGKTVTFQVQVTITDAGSASGSYLVISLPVTMATGTFFIFVGRQIGSGRMMQAVSYPDPTSVICEFYDAGATLVNDSYAISGSYQIN